MANLRKPDTKVTYNGVGFFGLLTLLFIGLKLSGVITWSWLWVISPLWLPTIILLVFVLSAIVIYAVIGIIAVVIAHFFTKK